MTSALFGMAVLGYKVGEGLDAGTGNYITNYMDKITNVFHNRGVLTPTFIFMHSLVIPHLR